MNALYSDLVVRNVKLVTNTPTPAVPSGSHKRRISREKSILLRSIVTGTARVSGKKGEWEMYVFSHVLLFSFLSTVLVQRVNLYVLAYHWTHTKARRKLDTPCATSSCV